jgi:hypothetical protein
VSPPLDGAEPAPEVAAGLRKGDVVTRIAWQHSSSKGSSLVRCEGDLLTALALIPPGSKVTLEIARPSPGLMRAVFEAIDKGWTVGKPVANPHHNRRPGEVHEKLILEYTAPAK